MDDIIELFDKDFTARFGGENTDVEEILAAGLKRWT
jgi:hypothetical protein